MSANVGGIDTGPASVDLHVAAVSPTQLLQLLQERPHAGLKYRIVRDGRQKHADASYPARLRRPRHHRPRRSSKPRYELPPFDHWITSSAVASSVSGIVRPRALAVLRLMRNSNLVGT